MIFAIFLMRGVMEGVELMVARFLGFMPIIGECGFIPKNFHEYTSSGAMEGEKRLRDVY